MKLIRFALLSLVFATTSVMADGHGQGHHGKGHHHGGKQGRHHVMRHANPMPNLMRVTKKHADQLDLNAEQSAALAAWRETHHKPMHARFDAVKEMEAELKQASLAGRPKAELMTLASKIMNVRTEIISLKTDCRDNLRRVLSPQQYDKVLSIYADKQARR